MKLLTVRFFRIMEQTGCHHSKHLSTMNFLILKDHLFHTIDRHAKLIHRPETKSQQQAYQTRLRSYRSAEKQRQQGTNYNDRYLIIGICTFIFCMFYCIGHGFRIISTIFPVDAYNHTADNTHAYRVQSGGYDLRNPFPDNGNPDICHFQEQPNIYSDQ